MSKVHSTLVDGLARNSESGGKWRFFRMPKRHFKINLCDVEPVVEMIYEASAARARPPSGGRSAISVHMHVSEIERRLRARTRGIAGLKKWHKVAYLSMVLITDLQARKGFRTRARRDGRTGLHSIAASDLRTPYAPQLAHILSILQSCPGWINRHNPT
jgi:hypothetical protein